MHVVIVYESLFGNTQAVADEIAAGLRAGGADVDVVATSLASPEVVDRAGLLVVGGPTHVHGMTSGLSRRGARDEAVKKHQREPDVAPPALRDWLETLGRGAGRRAAAFDTRAGGPRILTGSAERGIAQRLGRHGYDVVAEESFVVEGKTGPLQPGERDRARLWGGSLVAHVAAPR